MLVFRVLLAVLVLYVSFLLPMGKALSLLYLLLLPLVSIPFCVALLAWTLLFALLFPFLPAGVMSPLYHAVPWGLVVVFAARKRLLSGEAFHERGLARYGGPLRALLLLASSGLVLAIGIRKVPLWEIGGWLGALLILRHLIPPPERPAPRQRVAAFLLLSVSAAVSLALMEFAARWIVPPSSEQAPWIVMEHAKSDFMLQPGAESWYYLNLCDQTQVRMPIAISPQGLRDRVYGPKQEGEYRIVMLGDSFTMGWGVPEEHTLSRRLEERLREEWPDAGITVINAGAENFGPWQERYFLLERGFPLEPDLVIHQLFPGNDIENTLAKIGKLPRAYCAGAVEHAAQWRYRAQWQFRFDKWCRHRSALYRLVLKAMRREYLVASLRFLAPEGLPELPENAKRPFNIETCLREWYPDLHEGWRLFEEDVLTIKEDCEKRNVGYIAYTIPDVCVALDPSWRSATAAEGEDAYERYKASRLTEEFFVREGIEYVNVHGALATHPRRDALYFECDGHFTEAGVDMVVEELAERLISRGANDGPQE